MNRFARYPNNGHAVLAAHEKGHVRGLVLDATYGKGTWWTCAEGLTEVTGRIGMDLNPRKAARANWGPDDACGRAVCADFRRPPFRPGSVRTIFYDPRYKLNGTPTLDEDGFDERYGADDRKPWRQIVDEMVDGLATLRPGHLDEGLAQLLAPNGRLLAKCMDQVCSGRFRCQTYEMQKRAEAASLELVDRMEYEITPRPQPPGRRSKHFEANYSTLLIFGRPPITLRPLS